MVKGLYILIYMFNIALYGKPISELWSIIYCMGSHSVTCHLTQVNASPP